MIKFLFVLVVLFFILFAIDFVAFLIWKAIRNTSGQTPKKAVVDGEKGKSAAHLEELLDFKA